MKRWHALVVYLVLGPLLGGLVFWVGLTLGAMLESAPPTVVAAAERLVPSMQALRALPYILLAYYPVGLPAALAAGVAHAFLFRRLKPTPLLGLVCLAGVAANVALIKPEDLRWGWTFVAIAAVLPPLVSAAILSTGLGRLAGPRG